MNTDRLYQKVLSICLLGICVIIPEGIVAAEGDVASSPEAIKYVINTLLLLFSAALVMWMAAGFCMLEAGLVRSKSTAIICLKNVLLYAVACSAYYIVGYNLMYVDVGQFMGSLQLFISPTADEVELLSSAPQDFAFGPAVDTVSQTDNFSLAGAFFQMVFVATTASIISGALAERIKLWPFLIFVAILSAVLYPIIGAWTWGGAG